VLWFFHRPAPKGMNAVEHHSVARIDAEIKADSGAGISDDLAINGKVALAREDWQTSGEGKRVGREGQVADAGSVNRDCLSGRAHGDSQPRGCNGDGAAARDISVSTDHHVFVYVANEGEDVASNNRSGPGRSQGQDGCANSVPGSVSGCARSGSGCAVVNLSRFTDCESVKAQKLAIAKSHRGCRLVGFGELSQ